MKASDKAIVFGVLVAVLAVGFYLLLLAPKRQQASDLNDQINQLHASISEKEQVASFAEQARKDFPRYYGRLVVLGKAVPQQADTASMLVQLNTISRRNHVDFRSILLGSDSSSAGAGSSTSSVPSTTAPSSSSTASTGTSTTTTPSSASSTSTGSTASTSAASTSGSAASAAAPATESSAASLPIGATVGPAGLATLPYTLKFSGGFFDIANFIGGVDDLVQPSDNGVRVSPDGRLFTVDGFALQGGAPGSSPVLKGTFSVTTYATPADQSLTLGATPSSPSPVAPGAAPAQPASAVVAK